jgi:hypothetical protein
MPLCAACTNRCCCCVHNCCFLHELLRAVTASHRGRCMADGRQGPSRRFFSPAWASCSWKSRVHGEGGHSGYQTLRSRVTAGLELGAEVALAACGMYTARRQSLAAEQEQGGVVSPVARLKQIAGEEIRQGRARGGAGLPLLQAPGSAARTGQGQGTRRPTGIPAGGEEGLPVL